MRARNKPRPPLGESQIDEAVVAEANNDLAWEKPVRVRRKKAITLPLASDLPARAEFFARLHRETSLEDWLNRIIRERLDMEEAAFLSVKRELAAKNGGQS